MANEVNGVDISTLSRKILMVANEDSNFRIDRTERAALQEAFKELQELMVQNEQGECGLDFVDLSLHYPNETETEELSYYPEAENKIAEPICHEEDVKPKSEATKTEEYEPVGAEDPKNAEEMSEPVKAEADERIKQALLKADAEQTAKEASEKKINDLEKYLATDKGIFTKEEVQQKLDTLSPNELRTLMQRKNVIKNIETRINDKDDERLLFKNIAEILLEDRKYHLREIGRNNLSKEGKKGTLGFKDPVRDLSSKHYLEELKSDEAKTARADYFAEHKFYNKDVITRATEAFAWGRNERVAYKNLIELFANAPYSTNND